MNSTDFNELLNEERFTPFVITTHDGFSVAIGHEQRRHILVGKRVVALLDAAGGIIHIPYRSIAHVQELHD